MKVETKIHSIYKEWLKSGKAFRQLVDKHQYIYSNKRGSISMVKFLNYFSEGDHFYEIYCLEGDLFDDVERFKTKKEAEKQIKQYLGE